MFIKLHSFIQNPDYEESKAGLILNKQYKEMACMVNTEEILFVFEALNPAQGNSMIKFRNGELLTVKENLTDIPL